MPSRRDLGLNTAHTCSALNCSKNVGKAKHREETNNTKYLNGILKTAKSGHLRNVMLGRASEYLP